MKPAVVDFAAALKTLRERLGLTQEGMAQRLGASVGTYRKWEAGAFNPSGHWVIKIQQVCPDEETRALFSAPPPLAPGAGPAAPWPAYPPEPPVPTRATLMMNYRNVCVAGIELLYELARGGSRRASTHLHGIAEVVSRMVGELTRADLDDATRNAIAPSKGGGNSGAGEAVPPAARRKPAR